MVTVIMTIHGETNTKRTITEYERSVRIRRLKTLAHIMHQRCIRAKHKVVKAGTRGEENQGVVCGVTALLLSFVEPACETLVHFIQQPGRELSRQAGERGKVIFLRLLKKTHVTIPGSSSTPEHEGSADQKLCKSYLNRLSEVWILPAY